MAKHCLNTTKRTSVSLVTVCLLIVCLLDSNLNHAYCQSRTQRSTAIHELYSENHMISLVPVPLFFHGFRVDYDARLKNNLWINVAPQLNYHRKKSDSASLTGFSLEINLRYYVPNVKGLYFAAGIGAEYNQSEKLNSAFELYKVNTTRLGSQIQIGYTVKMWPRAMFDVYVGAAYRYALNKYPKSDYERIFKLDKIKPWSYQFSGVFMEAGIRIGFML